MEKFCQAARRSLALTELLLMLHQIRADPLLQGFHQFSWYAALISRLSSSGFERNPHSTITVGAEVFFRI